MKFQRVDKVPFHDLKLPDKFYKFRNWKREINTLTTSFHDPSWRSHVDDWFLNKMDSEFGVISLSKTKDNCPNWMNFGAGHTGLAVGLNPNMMFEDNTIICTGGDVEYYDPNLAPKLRAFCKTDQEK